MCVAGITRHGVMCVAEITRYGVKCVGTIAYARQNKRARCAAGNQTTSPKNAA